MIINQRITHQRAALSRVFRCAGCLLLMIFIGRVVLVSVYGYAGVPKFSINSASGSAEQQDDDKKDESKYTEKQFKYIDQDVFSLPVIASMFLSKPYFCFQTDFTTSHALAVLTPPPNC